MGKFVPARLQWWVWVGGGVAWGLLCVWVRHGSISTGREIEALMAQRNALVARVQALEKGVADERRLDQVEKRAASLGFSKLPASRLVIVPPETREGVIARFFGIGARPADAAATDTPAPARAETAPAPAPERKAAVRKARKPAARRGRTR